MAVVVGKQGDMRTDSAAAVVVAVSLSSSSSSFYAYRCVCVYTHIHSSTKKIYKNYIKNKV